MQRPGEQRVAARPLHFFLVVDVSGSMAQDGKIQSLNTAVRNAIPEMRQVAANNPFAELFVRTVRFGAGAQWIHPEPVRVESFEWEDLVANDGHTQMGVGLSLVADALATERMGERGYPPVIVLVSDGQPTDDHRSGIARVMTQPWGRKAVRLAIAIGRDAGHGPLEEFVNHPERPVLQANNAQTLTQYIRWATTQVIAAASSPSAPIDAGSGATGDGDTRVSTPLPQVPPPIDESEIW